MADKFHFTYIPSKQWKFMSNNDTQGSLMKWSMKGQIRCLTFTYNEHLSLYQRAQFVNDFFKDAKVVATINQQIPDWFIDILQITEIQINDVQCSVTSMKFFDRLLDPQNFICRESGSIFQCLDHDINGFTVTNKLRKMILDEEDEAYSLYNESEQDEFVFRIFRHLVLGGEWCQYDDVIQPYLDATKILYKDLVSVHRNSETNQIEIRSNVVQIRILRTNNKPMFPNDYNNIQNFAYFIIDPVVRSVTLFCHKYGGQF